MMTNPVGRLSANNAAFNWMNASNSLMKVPPVVIGNSSYNVAFGKNLETQMLNDSFNYKAYSAMADSQEKLQKANVKRSFSTFA